MTRLSSSSLTLAGDLDGATISPAAATFCRTWRRRPADAAPAEVTDHDVGLRLFAVPSRDTVMHSPDRTTTLRRPQLAGHRHGGLGASGLGTGAGRDRMTPPRVSTAGLDAGNGASGDMPLF
jgi:hypothetical protein